MGYKIKTYKGIEFTVESIDMPKFETELNDRALRTVAISEMVLSKRNIKIIVSEVPVEPGVGIYELTTADGEKYNVAIEPYNVKVINDKMNDLNKEFVLIGDVLIQSNNFDFLM